MNRAIAPPTFACTFVNAEFFASLVAILRDFVDILGEPTESEKKKNRAHPPKNGRAHDRARGHQDQNDGLSVASCILNRAS